MIILSKAQIIKMHEQVVAQTGGSNEVRDDGLLESAITAPFQAFQEYEPYPSLQQKAARLCYGLVMNHPFLDGNKRIGAHAMLVFLALNGIRLSYSQNELSGVILGVASGNLKYEELLQWIIQHQQ